MAIRSASNNDFGFLLWKDPGYPVWFSKAGDVGVFNPPIIMSGAPDGSTYPATAVWERRLTLLQVRTTGENHYVVSMYGEDFLDGVFEADFTVTDFAVIQRPSESWRVKLLGEFNTNGSRPPGRSHYSVGIFGNRPSAMGCRHTRSGIHDLGEYNKSNFNWWNGRDFNDFGLWGGSWKEIVDGKFGVQLEELNIWHKHFRYDPFAGYDWVEFTATTVSHAHPPEPGASTIPAGMRMSAGKGLTDEVASFGEYGEPPGDFGRYDPAMPIAFDDELTIRLTYEAIETSGFYEGAYRFGVTRYKNGVLQDRVVTYAGADLDPPQMWIHPPKPGSPVTVYWGGFPALSTSANDAAYFSDLTIKYGPSSPFAYISYPPFYSNIGDPAPSMPSPIFAGEFTKWTPPVSDPKWELSTGTACSVSPLVVGTTGSVEFDIVWGYLPHGLTMDSETGIVSGTPVHGGHGSAFAVSVTDSTGRHAVSDVIDWHVRFPMTIEYGGVFNNTDGDPTDYPGASWLLKTGEAVSFSPTVSGGLAPYRYVVAHAEEFIGGSNTGYLPGGLTLDEETGIISGTPTSINGQGYFIIGVYDADRRFSQALSRYWVTRNT